MNKPILSICIPTYNRAEYLEQCLEAIVHQNGFDNRVEVVISDNCSSDYTQEVGKKYEKEYPNVKYFRNDTNVANMNYPLVFRRATGELRKLTNDTVVYKPGALEYMLKAVNENFAEKPQVYFLNSGKYGDTPKYVNSLEEYIDTIGHLITWIRSVALWAEDCEDLAILVEKADSRLAQVPLLLENFEKHNGAVIYDDEIMDSINPKNKNLTYGLYNIFYDTFLGFVKPYMDDGKISRECYERLRKNLLFEFFITWIITKEIDNGQFRFSDEDLEELLKSQYKDEYYFNEYKRKLTCLRIKMKIKRLIGRN